ncbi:hypothetical protein CYMTET_32440 [Cymbomonas tetramitiformis]|uniref:Cadherin-like beta-sandwich-like domain-containing protein n=1 Tax=Cymbomonas tetramitiformis TaxID=36881 RepID=A0AAE0FF16_9CHLO|nr:hypothetical protein CYMTET_32440 [Cymbomonas tetramitiformis]
MYLIILLIAFTPLTERTVLVEGRPRHLLQGVGDNSGPDESSGLAIPPATISPPLPPAGCVRDCDDLIYANSLADLVVALSDAANNLGPTEIYLTQSLQLDGRPLQVDCQKDSKVALRGDCEGLCVVDGMGATRILELTLGSNARFTATQLKLVNGLIADGSGGGALYLRSEHTTAQATFYQCTFEGNEARDLLAGQWVRLSDQWIWVEVGSGGGAVFLGGGNSIFQESIFRDNSCYAAPGADVYGGAVAITGELTQVAFQGCSFTGNLVDGSGGVLGIGHSKVAVDFCTFQGNRATMVNATNGPQGGVVMSRGELLMSNSLLQNNVVERSGPMESCHSALDLCTSGGGAIALTSDYYSRTVVIRCTMTSNVAEGGGGGAIFVNRPRILRSDDNTTEETFLPPRGDSGVHNLSSCIFFFNRATLDDGGTDVDGSAGRDSDQAGSGGAVLLEPGSISTFESCVFMQCEAAQHGGAIAVENGVGTELVMSRLEGNVAAGYGGAVWFAAHVRSAGVEATNASFISTSFTDNTGLGGSAEGVGGVLVLISPTSSFRQEQGSYTLTLPSSPASITNYFVTSDAEESAASYWFGSHLTAHGCEVHAGGTSGYSYAEQEMQGVLEVTAMAALSSLNATGPVPYQNDSVGSMRVPAAPVRRQADEAVEGSGYGGVAYLTGGWSSNSSLEGVVYAGDADGGTLYQCASFTLMPTTDTEGNPLNDVYIASDIDISNVTLEAFDLVVGTQASEDLLRADDWFEDTALSTATHSYWTLGRTLQASNSDSWVQVPARPGSSACLEGRPGLSAAQGGRWDWPQGVLTTPMLQSTEVLVTASAIASFEGSGASPPLPALNRATHEVSGAQPGGDAGEDDAGEDDAPSKASRRRQLLWQNRSPVYLQVGVNYIEVLVLAWDGVTKVTYSMEINRLGTVQDSYLESLALLAYDTQGVQVSPPPSFEPDFRSDTFNYRVQVPELASTVSVSPVAVNHHPDVVMTVDSQVVTGTSMPVTVPDAGTQSPPGEGIEIVVTAQDGQTASTYTLVISDVRLPPSPEPPQPPLLHRILPAPISGPPPPRVIRRHPPPRPPSPPPRHRHRHRPPH